MYQWLYVYNHLIIYILIYWLGYDTAAHVAEETTDSHKAAPWAMMGSVVNCLFLGKVMSRSRTGFSRFIYYDYNLLQSHIIDTDLL
jgi:hypothetical protein